MVVSTLVFAAELAMIALSFNLLYQVVGFANFAHGEFITFGAFLGVASATVMPLAAAVVCGAVGTGLLAVLLSVGVFQRFPRSSIGTLMIVSAGVAIALRGVIQAFFGVDSRRFDEPTSSVSVLGTTVTLIHMIIVGTAIASVLVFAAVLRYTRAGRHVRAVADDLALTEAHGVRGTLVINQVWFISGAMAGLAGVLIGIDTYANPEMGISLLIPLFAAAVVGGVGSPFGAILGAALVSLFQTAVVTIDFGELLGAGSYFLGSEYKSIVAFALLIIVLMIRPNGFFGQREARA